MKKLLRPHRSPSLILRRRVFSRSMLTAPLRVPGTTHACLRRKLRGGEGDRYARFYTFTLDEATDIIINLSSDEDTYLYLLNGHGKEGETLHSNDDIASAA